MVTLKQALKSKLTKKELSLVPSSFDTIGNIALFTSFPKELKNKGINKQSRHYHKQSKFKGSFRSFRTNAIRYLLKQKQQKGKADVLEAFVETDLRKQEAVFNAEEILASLIKDGLIVKHKNLYQIQSRKE